MFHLAPASAPRNFEVIVYSSTVLLLSWDNPPTQEHNGLIRHYNVRILEIDTGKALQLTSNKTFIRVTELHPYYLYKCSVAAYTVADSPYIGYVTARTKEDCMCLYSFSFIIIFQFVLQIQVGILRTSLLWLFLL